MRVSHLLTIAVSSMISAYGSAATRSVTGAELRASSGNRPITRTVSTTRAKQEPQTAKPQNPPAPSASRETVLEPDDGLIYESGGFDECMDWAECSPYAEGYWAEFDLLVWWRDNRNFPALVTTQPNDGVVPGATVLFGGNIDEQARPGGRLEAGLWLDPREVVGVGVHYLAVGEAPVRFAISSDDLGFFARPFVDVSTNPPTPTAFAVANNLGNPPSTGNLDLRTDSDVQAGDFFVRWALWKSCCYQLDFLAGYQFARIDEDLVISSTTVTPAGNATETLAVTDLFDIKNEFHGGHLGLQGEYRRGCWSLEMLSRFGFGNMRQTVFIDGETRTVDAAGNVDVRASGLLAQALTNGGLHQQSRFSYFQDAGVKLAYYPVECVKVSVGYSVMYWSSVARHGTHIDTGVDSRLLQVPPPANATRPAFSFRPTDFYLHGLNLGLEVAF